MDQKKTDYGNWVPLALMKRLAAIAGALLAGEVLLIVLDGPTALTLLVGGLLAAAVILWLYMLRCRVLFDFNRGGLMGQVHQYLTDHLPWDGRGTLPAVQYTNLYGPTEVTVDCTWYPIQREFADGERIPIGRACANKEVFLLDEHLQPVPPGQPGELCVRGIGLAKGYFGQWDKTRSAFIQDPRNPNYPDLIYRTGDLAVMDEAGLFTFLTRQDGQIKHMGYRIELGEIETVLNSIPSMEEVACLFDPERDRIHCIYTGSQESKDIAKLARASLPRYMVPNLYHKVAVMPHNPNGKIDRPKLKEEWIHGNDHRL